MFERHLPIRRALKRMRLRRNQRRARIASYRDERIDAYGRRIWVDWAYSLILTDWACELQRDEMTAAFEEAA